MKKSSFTLLSFVGVLLAALLLAAEVGTPAASYSAVSVAGIDYETLEMKINKGYNPIVYYSTDGKKTWNEVEGDVTDDNRFVFMDIAWAAPTSDVTIYLKGNEEKTVTKVTLPKQNSTFKVKFDKVDNTFEFSDYDDREYFWWRKATDYNWYRVNVGSEGSLTPLVEAMRLKGSKLVFKLGQIPGTSETNVGERPSKEITVSVPKYASAPSVTLNITKLVVNTKSSMEYKLPNDGSWTTCTPNMLLEDLVYAFANGKPGTTTSILFRVAATETKPASLTSVLTVRPRESAPTIGDVEEDITITYKAGQADISIRCASKDHPVEYALIKPDDDFEESTAKWKTISGAKTITLKEKSYPAGTLIVFRYKGAAANATKKTELRLPSVCVSSVLSY